MKKSYGGDEIEDLRGKITPRNAGFYKVQKDTNQVIYRQVFEERTGFIPGLSILDLLFCEGGKKAGLLLTEI